MGTATRAFWSYSMRPLKHFIPLWGQQLADCVARWFSPARNISYPYGDSNMAVIATAHTPTQKHFIPLWGQQLHRVRHGGCNAGKHFIPLWGQQLTGAKAARLCPGNISYPYGDSNALVWLEAKADVETFHTPMGTKRKPICPIRHIGFYFIRYCYLHVTPPIPSAVLMPTPAYGAKCSSRFAIVR